MKKKLSANIRKGFKITQAAGIRQGKSHIFLTTGGGICQVCALGNALVGAFGLEKATKLAFSNKNDGDYLYDLAKKTFLNANKPTNDCLVNTAKVTYNDKPTDVVWELNDSAEKTPLEIADILASCGY